MFGEAGILLNGLLLGVMVSFIVVTSPTVFKTLDEENSRSFLRFIFPRLFIFCFVISTLMSLFFALAGFSFGLLAGLVMAVSFLINTYLLTPKINEMKDLMLAGNSEAKSKFKKLHFASVLLYLINMVLIAFIFIIYYSK